MNQASRNPAGELAHAGPGMLLFLASVTLALFGLVVLFSAGLSQPQVAHSFVTKQACWLLIALVACGMAARVDLEQARGLVWGIGGVSLLALILVLVPHFGHEVNGARRWFRLGPFSVQVSDFVKVAFVLVLAHYLAANQRYLKSFQRGFLIPSAIITSVVLLVALEPDYGTAFLAASVGGLLLFLAGARMAYLLPAGALGLALFSLAVRLDPERWDRVISFLNVEDHRTAGAYQLCQALLAFGVGGLGGVGLGNGRQQMTFLPEAHTDFIFPVIGEEMGFFATSTILLVFAVFFVIGLYHTRHAFTLFQFLTAVGALLFVTLQALINLGVATGCLPTKGISLPFISYGGSNLVVMFLFIGLILNCFRSWSEPLSLRPREL